MKNHVTIEKAFEICRPPTYEVNDMLEEGDIIILTGDHSVYADIPEHFVFSNKKGCFSLTHSRVKLLDDFEYLQGEYVVYKTSCDGGGTGHGPGDIYPDGHHVFCEKLNDKVVKAVKVDFYQTGSFTAMITDIEPIGRAKRAWVR